VQPAIEAVPLRRLGTNRRRSSGSIHTTPSPDEEEPAEEPENMRLPIKSRPPVIRVTRPFRRFWDLSMILLALYTCASVPFTLAYKLTHVTELIVVQSVVDCVFAIDIGLNFYTTYLNAKGKEILKRRKIVQKYLGGAFWLDLIATFPLDNILIALYPDSSVCRVLLLKDMLRIRRILNLPTMVRYTRVQDEFKAFLRLLVIITYLLLISHLFGCFWFAIVQTDHESWLPVPDFLTGETKVFEDDLWGQYSMVFYHSVWLLVGGEVGARNGMTGLCAAAMITIGTVITAMLFGEMEVIASSLNRRQTQFQEVFDSAITTIKGMKLPPKTVNRILDYITSSQSQHTAQEEYETFMKFVSPSLLREATAALYTPIISKNQVLQGDERVQKFLQQTMRTRFTQPEEEIISEGALGDALFLVLNGKFSVLVVDRYKTKHQVKHLEPGALFGEIALVYNTVRTSTVLSIGYSIVAQLLKRDFERLVNLFPQLLLKLREHAYAYTDPWKDFIQETLLTIPFITNFPDYSINELPYLMEFRKLEKGTYLFKPGEKCQEVFIVAEGLVEMAVTLNEKSLHITKNKILPERQREPEPKVQRRRISVVDYAAFDVGKDSIFRLKPRTEIVPIFKNNKLVGAITRNEELPPSTYVLGDYPQEVVIEELGPGTVIGAHAIHTEQIWQLQCKVIKSAKIYSLKRELIESLKKAPADINPAKVYESDVNFLRHGLKVLEEKKGLVLDYHFNGDVHFATRRRWKNVILRAIFSNRERMSKGMNFIAHMLPKLRAIMACENAGNFELAARVERDEVPPHHILEDGTLDPTIMSLASGDNGSLSLSHPIMKTFRAATAAVTQPGGEVVQEFGRLTEEMKKNKTDLKAMRKDMNFLHYSLLKLLTSLGEKERADGEMERLLSQSEEA